MLFLFIINQIITFSSQGYYTLAFPGKDEFKLDLTNKICIFFGNDISEKFKIYNNTKEIFPFTNETTTLLKDDTYQVTMKKAAKLIFWIIDKPICDSNILYLETPNTVQLDYNLPNTTKPICVIFQNQFAEGFALATLKSANPYTQSMYYDSLVIGDPKIKCELGRKCLMNSRAPFFFKTINTSSSRLTLKFKAIKPKDTVKNCSFEYRNAIFKGVEPHLQCGKMFDDVSILVYISFFVFIALGLIALLTMFIRNVCCPQIYKVDFSSIKKAPFAHELPRKEDPNAKDDEDEKVVEI